MKVLSEYTWNYLKKNRKNTIAILISVFIATVFLSTVVQIIYIDWDYHVNDAIFTNGNYHGRLSSPVDGSKLPYLIENQKIEKVYIRTEFYTRKIDSEKPYINISYMDKAYWDNMGEKNHLIEGRPPQEVNEIVVMGSFIKENPQYELGSKINVEYGHRQINGEPIDLFELWSDEETFVSEDRKEYTIVGIITGNSRSYEPYYGGLGLLDSSSIDDDMQVYTWFRMKNPRGVFRDLPEIGAELGFERGAETEEEYTYSADYNYRYLRQYGIFPPSYRIGQKLMYSMTTMIFIILLVIVLFTIIIYNVFTIWSRNRLAQLGILKSIGATPIQIKKTVRLEALFISAAPIISGILGGHLFCYLLINRISEILNSVDSSTIEFNIAFKTNPVIILVIAVLSFITILLSIEMPARRLSKLLPIEAIKYDGLDFKDLPVEKRKIGLQAAENNLKGVFKDFLRANKRGFKTTIISITLSTIMLFSFLTLMAGVYADEILNRWEMYYPIEMRALSDTALSENLFEEIDNLPSVEDIIRYKSAFIQCFLDEKSESKEFKERGGFKGTGETEYSLMKSGDFYEVPTRILGLNKDDFDEYAISVGLIPEEYYDNDNLRSIMVNLVKEDIYQPLSRARFIPYLDESVEKLHFTERRGEHTGSIHIETKTDKLPIKDFYLSEYEIVLVVPMDVLNSIMEKFTNIGYDRHTEYIKILTDNKSISMVKKEVKEILRYFMPESDYYIYDKMEIEEGENASRRVVYLVAISITAFLGIIGTSNAYSSINNNLRNRRREFAILKSVGMRSDVLKKMLIREGLYYSIYPFIYSTPICILILLAFAKANRRYTLVDYLIYLDYWTLVIYIIVIPVSIFLAYYFGIRKIEKDNIVDVIKEEF